jgi:hypothetical protein
MINKYHIYKNYNYVFTFGGNALVFDDFGEGEPLRIDSCS